VRIAEVETLLVGSREVGANLVVRITTDTGVVGLGQSGAWGFPDATIPVVAQFREYLLGQDPFRIEHIGQVLYRMRPFRGSILSGAISAIDIALWDIKGRAFDVPVWELLGGRVRDRVRLHALVFGDDPESIARLAAEAVAGGFTAIKLDPLAPGYQDRAIPALVAGVREMATAARDVVGPDVDLIFELHRKLTPLQAVPVVEALADFHPLFVEDPIQIDSVMIQGELATRLAAPLANGERMNTIWEFRDLLAAGGPQFVRPDLGLAGGITGCRKVAALAEAHHAALVSHNYLGALLTSASIHLDVAIPNVVTQEYYLQDEASDPGNALFRTTLVREGGYMLAPEAPGLGVELDESVAAASAPGWLPNRAPLRADGSPALAV
jgi:galactonate dehydratase